MKLPALKERSEHRYNLLPILTAGFKAFKLLYIQVLHCYGVGKLIRLDNGMNSVILVVSCRLVIEPNITLTRLVLVLEKQKEQVSMEAGVRSRKVHHVFT